MLSYEICKQLKEAGLLIKKPERYNDGIIISLIPEGITSVSEGDIVFVPSLSDLIDACGDYFLSLNRNFDNDKDRWFADTRTHECNCGKSECRGYNWECEYGETPEEAVAKLYLAIKRAN